MGRYDLSSYEDDDEPKWYVKALLLALLCGAVWVLVKCAG